MSFSHFLSLCFSLHFDRPISFTTNGCQNMTFVECFGFCSDLETIYRREKSQELPFYLLGLKSRFIFTPFPHSLSLAAFSRHVFQSACLTRIATRVPRVIQVFFTWFIFFALGFIFLFPSFYRLPVLFVFLESACY